MICEDEGAHLAIIDDADENRLVRPEGPGSSWIGLTDEGMEGTFEWVDGSPLTYTSWRDAEPNNRDGNEHYVELNPNGRWNDVGLDARDNNHGLCECPQAP